MTRTGALPHRVTLIRRALTTRDARNNEVPTDLAPLTGIPARVDILKETEDIDDRDRRREVIDVVIPAQWHGRTLSLDSVDAMEYNGVRYELTGGAILATDHAGRPDHYEFPAHRIIG